MIKTILKTKGKRKQKFKSKSLIILTRILSKQGKLSKQKKCITIKLGLLKNRDNNLSKLTNNKKIK